MEKVHLDEDNSITFERIKGKIDDLLCLKWGSTKNSRTPFRPY